MNKCGNCKYFDDDYYQCHRFPPVRTIQKVDSGWQGNGLRGDEFDIGGSLVRFATSSPRVSKNDWCGEFKFNPDLIESKNDIEQDDPGGVS